MWTWNSRTRVHTLSQWLLIKSTHQPPGQQSAQRSGRERHFPDYYGDRVYLSLSEPTTFKDIVSTPEKDHWLQAMEKEMTSLKDNDV